MFFALATLIIFLALALLVAKRIVRAVLALLGSVVGLAFLYFLLGADAAGAAQLMVYAGGVMVLMIFGVMTATELSPTRGPLSRPVEIASGFTVAALLLVGMLRLFVPALAGLEGVATLGTYTGGTLKGAGQELIMHQAAPFEWAAVVLLVALAFAVPFTFRAGKSKHFN
jgi:NADH-quinone oxidoreductase subunit J